MISRCQDQYEIAILDQLDVISKVKLSFLTLDVSSNVKLASCPLDVSSNMKLPFMTTRCQQQCEIAYNDHKMLITM